MSLLEATGVRKNFGGVVALNGADLACRDGTITGLLGANGSGKSTMSKIIAGVHGADGGTVVFQGAPVAYRNPNEARQAGIGMVFQNLSLVGTLPVWQNIVLGTERRRGAFLDDTHAIELAESLTQRLLPSLDVRTVTSRLHPGEMQIVEIAKALATSPRLLILDEPTAALEQEQVNRLFGVMRELAADGVGMIFTSHRLWEVMEICDDIFVFRNGKTVAHIDYAQDVKDPQQIVAHITGETRRPDGGGRASVASTRVVLEAQHLSLDRRLRDVSFTLHEGEIFGVGGLAGQGQYELLLALAGNYPTLAGSVRLDGVPRAIRKPAQAVEQGMLLVPGDRQLEGLFLTQSVFSNLIFPRVGRRGHALFTPEQRYRREAREIVSALSIKTHSLDSVVRTLSGGNQQKVVVGKWLPFDINVLLLADPAKGVDVGAKRDLYDSIAKLVAEKRTSVILYASDNEELIGYCDRLMIMYEGSIVATLAGEEINDDAIVAASLRVDGQGVANAGS